jgi:hypothetical protein
LNILDKFFEKTQISNFMKIRPVGTELFRAGTDGHDEGSSRFSQFRERAEKLHLLTKQCIYVSHTVTQSSLIGLSKAIAMGSP